MQYHRQMRANMRMWIIFAKVAERLRRISGKWQTVSGIWSLVPTNETHSQLQEGDVVSFYDEEGNDTSPYSGTAKIIEIEYIQKLEKDYTVFYFKANRNTDGSFSFSEQSMVSSWCVIGGQMRLVSKG